MKKVVLSLLSIITFLCLISCGSKPAAEEPKPEAPKVEEKVEEIEEASEEIPVVKDLTDLIHQIEDARKAAVEAGAEEKAPEQLKQADDLFASLKESGLENGADTIIARYKLLADYIKAKDAKDEIDENDYASYAQSNYDRGCDSLKVVEEAFADSSVINSTITDAAADAYSQFNTVLSVAYKKLAKEERAAAYEAKKKADSVKAGVAQKERYNTAADDFKNGDSLYAMQSPKKAIEKYISAKDEFNALYEEVYEKRVAAQAAIDAAKKRVEEAEQFAEEADAEAPITEPVEGIEDEDAVLLEEDEYEDPKEAEADIAEDIDDVEIEETEEAE